MNKPLLSCLVIALTCTSIVESGNILMWMSMGSKSHYNLWKPLALELAKRNHTLTMVTAYPFKALEKMENVNYITVDADMSIAMNSTEIFEGESIHGIENWKKMADVRNDIQDILLAHPAIQKLMKDKPKFDVTIIDAPFAYDLGLYLANKVFDSPVILFFPGLKFPIIDLAMGNPINPSYIPMEVHGYTQYMTFPQRLLNTISVLFTPFVFDNFAIPPMEQKLKEVLNLSETPDLSGMANNAAFAFYNGHPVFDSVAPINPNTVLIGGLHLGPASPLEGELKEWLDDAKDGAIFVSYGSVLTGSQLPEAKRKILVDTFSKLKQRVIWKWETEEMEGKPANVLLKKWLPQQDILAHPNVKLFISHGGFLSTEESIYHKVPVIVMPGFGDQFSNAIRAERMGYGRELKWTDLNDHNLLELVNVMLEDTTCKAKAEYYGTIMGDNPISSLEKAVYHTEYVMRHKGAPHLRSPAKDLYWFQYFLLDVIAFVVFVVFLVLFVVFKMVKLAVRKVCGCGNKAKKVKKN